MSPFVVLRSSPVSNSSTKTAEAPVYGYAKRPRERAANRLSRPDTQLAKRIQFFAVALGQPVGAVGVHRRKRWRPGRAFEKRQQKEKAASKAQTTPFGETKPNSSMITCWPEWATGRHCERQEQRDLQPNDHGPGRKRRSSEFTLDSRGTPRPLGGLAEHGRGRANRGRTNARAWNDPALDRENLDEWIASNT